MESKDGHRQLAAKIVGSYSPRHDFLFRLINPHRIRKYLISSFETLRHHKVGASQLPDLIGTVHRSLRELGRQSPIEEVLTLAVSVRQSVRHDYVVCLDCGYRGKTLRRHISSRHGLSRDEYLKRWELQPHHPLTAPAYSEHRSTLAKQLGLGRKPKAEEAPTPIPGESAVAIRDEETDHPSPRRTTRSGSTRAEATAFSGCCATICASPDTHRGCLIASRIRCSGVQRSTGARLSAAIR
jgi:predicted transcriptional regulator